MVSLTDDMLKDIDMFDWYVSTLEYTDENHRENKKKLLHIPKYISYTSLEASL